MKRVTVKHLMLGLGVFFFGGTIQSYAQDVVLPEVKVSAINYKYLSMVDDEELAIPIRKLEERVATFDLKNSEFYEINKRVHHLNFKTPEGTIQATYDNDGKLLKVVEKFKGVAIPASLALSVSDKYPNWRITKGVYRVSYYDKAGVTKTYKLLLVNGDEKQWLKLNDKGELI